MNLLKNCLFFFLILIILACERNSTIQQPYKRPFPTKAYYNGELRRIFNLDSNERLIGFTRFANGNSTDFTIVYNNQDRIDSVYRIFNGLKYGTYWKYPSVDSIYFRRFQDTSWDYSYGGKISVHYIKKISPNYSGDYVYELIGDSIIRTQQTDFVLSDSINPLWIEDNPLFSWYYLGVLDDVFSARMPESSSNFGSGSTTYYDIWYDAQGRLVQRRTIAPSGSYTMDLTYN